MIKTTNPFLNSLKNDQDAGGVAMSFNGVLMRSVTLLFYLVATTILSWIFVPASSCAKWAVFSAVLYVFVGGAAFFKKKTSTVAAPMFAAFEGIFFGTIAVALEKHFPGVVLQALFISFLVFALLLLIYLIKSINPFLAGVFAALCAIVFSYYALCFCNYFGIQLPVIYGGGFFSVAFSFVVTFTVSLNFVLALSFIKSLTTKTVDSKHMEWYAALGLIFTFIWLFFETFRLLLKASKRTTRISSLFINK